MLIRVERGVERGTAKGGKGGINRRSAFKDPQNREKSGKKGVMGIESMPGQRRETEEDSGIPNVRERGGSWGKRTFKLRRKRGIKQKRKSISRREPPTGGNMEVRSAKHFPRKKKKLQRAQEYKRNHLEARDFCGVEAKAKRKN